MFALQVVCNHLALNPQATGLWIDTTGDFSPTKADAVLRSTEPHEVCIPERNTWAVTVLTVSNRSGYAHRTSAVASCARVRR